MSKWKDPGIDILFGSKNTKPNTEDNNVIDLNIEELNSFPQHPFKVKDDERMQALIESVKLNGIIMPITVRINNEKYEIISGHRRVYAAKKNNFKVVPSIIIDVDDESANILMVDTNLTQREEILPSEKAFAYKIKVESLKRKAGRPSQKNEVHSEPHLINKSSREIVAEEAGEAKVQITRYIRLTFLIQPLLDKVDDGVLGFIAAVDLSYLNKQNQEIVNTVIEIGNIKPTKLQAANLKALSSENKLNQKVIQDILLNKESSNFKTIKYPVNKLKQYLPKDIAESITQQRAQEILEEAMQLWKDKNLI